MFWIHAFFEAIGILVVLGYLLGTTDLVDFSLRIGPPGQNAKIRNALDQE